MNKQITIEEIEKGLNKSWEELAEIGKCSVDEMKDRWLQDCNALLDGECNPVLLPVENSLYDEGKEIIDAYGMKWFVANDMPAMTTPLKATDEMISKAKNRNIPGMDKMDKKIKSLVKHMKKSKPKFELEGGLGICIVLSEEFEFDNETIFPAVRAVRKAKANCVLTSSARGVHKLRIMAS